MVITFSRLEYVKTVQTWEAYVTASSCRADNQPLSMVSSGMESLYHTSGGLTLDRELVSTTESGCRSPILTERWNKINFTNLPKQ